MYSALAEVMKVAGGGKEGQGVQTVLEDIVELDHANWVKASIRVERRVGQMHWIRGRDGRLERDGSGRS